MKKTLLVLLASAGLALADPSQNGLEHRNSCFDPSRGHGNEFCDHKIHSVPDAGSTLGLLSMGVVAIAGIRRKLQC
jgi:hypothetical protein